MSRALRVLFTVDPEIAVPPVHYGGIERIVDMLVRGLVRRGHRVHLFAHAESRTPATLVPYAGRTSHSLADTLRNALQVRRYVRKEAPVDVVHNFGRLAYLSLLLRSGIPMIQSYQRPVTRRSVRWGSFLSGGRLVFAACSRYCAGTAGTPEVPWEIVPNGVPVERYSFSVRVPSDAPLVFLGRLERIKGAHTAIEVARRCGRKLVLAGNTVLKGADRDYFSKEILPRCDGKRAEYVGPVDDRQKADLLKGALALLFPVEWDEPFGIVMAEALACGTPVIAFERGATPEVVRNGETGFLCRSVDEMVESVSRVGQVDRANCRRVAEEKFSDTVIVDAYERLYLRLVQGRSDGEGAR